MGTESLTLLSEMRTFAPSPALSLRLPKKLHPLKPSHQSLKNISNTTFPENWANKVTGVQS